MGIQGFSVVSVMESLDSGHCLNLKDQDKIKLSMGVDNNHCDELQLN